MKLKRFIIMEIKNISKSLVNGGRLIVRTKTKTFGNIRIKKN